jgi:hypothetical protein
MSDLLNGGLSLAEKYHFQNRETGLNVKENQVPGICQIGILCTIRAGEIHKSLGSPEPSES